MPTISSNNKARFDYNITETFDAGLALEGREVKSAKSGNVSLSGSYITFKNQELYLINCHIGPYKYAENADYNPTQNRKILLTKKEIYKLIGKEKGTSIIPIEMYTTPRGLIKLKIGIAKPRKKTDKREYIKKRESQKEIRSNY